MKQLLAIALLAAVPLAAQQPQAPVREITQISGDLYRVRNNGHYSVFLVTAEGIILADPISTEFAAWLKPQLAEQFKVPVRYVLYTHSHWDHAEGGAAFADTAQFIAHENTRRNMERAFPQIPGGVKDADGSGRIERPETDDLFGQNFARFDRNGDGGVAPAEYWQEIRPVDRTYSDRMTLTLGGKSVELIHVAPNHADDTTILYFPAERVAFTADTFTGRGIPNPYGDFEGQPLSSWIRAFRDVEAINFERFYPGHGAPATKAEIAARRAFFEDLVSEVSAGIRAGKTAEQLKAELALDKYKDWGNYAANRPLVVEAAFVNLRTMRQN